MRRIIGFAGMVVLLSVLVLACGTSGGAKTPMDAGTYTATVRGMHGPLSVQVELGTDAINSVKVTSHAETPGVSDWAVELIPQRVVENQSLAVDVVTGVTITSHAILSGVEDCLTQAGAKVSEYKKTIRTAKAPNQSLAADVIIVGGGGAGLAAANAAVEKGASVILIEKSGFLGGNSIMAGGIYNVANTRQQDAFRGGPGEEKLVNDALAEEPISDEHKAMQDTVRAEFEAFKNSNRTIYDSPSWHALQTWNGGDKIAVLPIVYEMTSNALAGKEWLESMGMEFEPYANQGTGSLYPRTLTAVLPNGTGYINAFRNGLVNKNGYTLLMETAAKGLITQGGRVVGVNAEGKTGNKITLRANKGVILATGGFAGNVKLRQQYCQGEKWPDLGPRLNTSNMPAVTGDGIFFARDAGAQLVNMDQIQLLQVCNPITGATGDIAHGGKGVQGYFFINKEGNRFTREDGRRDEVSIAIMAQTDNMCYLVVSADAIEDPANSFTLDGRSVAYMLENNISDFVTAPTLADLANILGVSADNLAATVNNFNSHVDSRTPDEFGRVLYTMKLTKGPWYAYPRKPAAHHTMGGVRIDESTRALKADGTPVPGLYCAGEITGVVHGGNRLGGNALVDFTVFGRIAGTSAAEGK
ncbi:MAG: FAD-dependent oxidoreductase [Treponema sp.]|nr:FAD-dependent oxidoreductase [Treponema sp.]